MKKRFLLQVPWFLKRRSMLSLSKGNHSSKMIKVCSFTVLLMTVMGYTNKEVATNDAPTAFLNATKKVELSFSDTEPVQTDWNQVFKSVSDRTGQRGTYSENSIQKNFQKKEVSYNNQVTRFLMEGGHLIYIDNHFFTNLIKSRSIS